MNTESTIIGNRVHLGDFEHMTSEQIAQLPPELLTILQEEAEQEAKASSGRRTKINAAIERRFGERARSERSGQGKDTGVVRFDVDGVEVVADLPKKVVWDQEELRRLHNYLDECGENASEYITVDRKVSESKYGSWPVRIREMFEPARTVTPGSQKITLKLAEQS